MKGAAEPGGSDDGMTMTIAPFSLYRYVHSQTWMNLQLHCHLDFGLCGLSSWGAPTPVQWIVLKSLSPDWLSGSVV